MFTTKYFFYIISLICSLISILFYFSDYQYPYYIFSLILFFSIPLYYLFTKNLSSFIISETIGILYIVYIPTASLFFNGSTEYALILSITFIFFAIIPGYQKTKFVVKKLVVNQRFRIENNNKSLWFLSIIVVSIVPIVLGEVSAAFPIFAGALAISITLSEKIIKSHNLKINSYVYLAIYLSISFLFYFYTWSGGGRILFGAIVSFPFLLLVQYRDFYFRLYHIIFAGPLLIGVGHIIRYGEVDFTRLHVGSVGTPVLNTIDLVKYFHSYEIKGVEAMMGQFSLFFLGWVPRSIWSSKPIGLGLTFVDDHLSREGASDEHSTAVGFIGELIWFLGPYFPIGLLVIVMTFYFTRRVLLKISFGSFAPVIMFDAFIPNYLWGGLASFGARVWFFVIPALFVIWLQHTLKRRALRKVS